MNAFNETEMDITHCWTTLNFVFFLVSLLLKYSSIIITGFLQQLISKPVYDVKDFFCKIQHGQVWWIWKFWIMAKKDKRSVGPIGHNEGVTWKTTKRHEWHILAGTESEGCGNYQALFGLWRDVSCHGWGIASKSLGKTRKSAYVYVIVKQTLS